MLKGQDECGELDRCMHCASKTMHAKSRTYIALPDRHYGFCIIAMAAKTSLHLVHLVYLVHTRHINCRWVCSSSKQTRTHKHTNRANMFSLFAQALAAASAWMHWLALFASNLTETPFFQHIVSIQTFQPFPCQTCVRIIYCSSDPSYVLLRLKAYVGSRIGLQSDGILTNLYAASDAFKNGAHSCVISAWISRPFVIVPVQAFPRLAPS